VAAPAEEPAFEYHKPKRRRWVKRTGLVVGALVVVAGGWIAGTALLAAHNIITKSGGGAPALANKVNLTTLKGEGDGRINILMLGIGGQGHEAPNLSDTIMVMSIDPKTKDAAMLSIPRDLYVQIPATGKYKTQYSKINAANSYGGPELAQKVVEKVIGVPIHYYVVVDFSGFRQAIDSVGGIDLTVAKALRDPLYPCDDGTKLAGKYCPINITAGVHHMTGAQALQFARSRETTSDFDRAARQQQVLLALRLKAMQLSTLTNPIKLTGLINTMGSHVKTDMQLDEMKKFALIAKDIDTTKVTNKVLDTGKTDSLLIDGSGLIAGAGSIELPKAGNFAYSDIQDFVKNIFVDHYITDENARIEVQNGSGKTGIAGLVATSLKAAHYNVGDPVNAPDILTKSVIYDYTNGKKPYTINYLEHRFGVKAQKMTAPTATPSTTTTAGTSTPPEIRIILGSDYKAPVSSN
jgi:LCP family protein required for cell wall assembly